MYDALPAKDLRAIGKSLIIIIIIVIMGLSVVERQLNTLTQERAGVEFLNIRREVGLGHYVVYLFGKQYQAGTLLPVGKIVSKPREIEVLYGRQSLAIPTYVGVDCTPAFEKLNIGLEEIIKLMFYAKKNINTNLSKVQKFFSTVSLR